MVVDCVFKQLAIIASEKEWPRRKLTSDEVYNILISPNSKKNKKISVVHKPFKKTLKYDKIDFALVEIKRINDPRYVNIITARKIEKTDKKLSKFWFDNKLRLCCPQEYKKKWEEAVEHYQSLIEDSESEEFSDNFDWATDESGDNSDIDCWDYMTDDLKIPKNLVKNIFS